MLRVLALLFAVVGLVCIVRGPNLTVQPNAYGPDVVEAVVNIIRENCIYADDRRFLRRLSYVESHDGTDPKTFRSGYDGGIWQVDEAEFLETQHSASLTSQYNIIRNVLHIDWNSVHWSDLRKPLYSGLAAALFSVLKGNGTPLSWKTEDQGKFWEKYFHQGSSATNFTRLASILDLGCTPNQAIDLVFVVDRSSSLSQEDLLRAKYFMKEIVDGFPIGGSNTRVGVVTYADTANVEFYLNQHLNKAAVDTAIDNINYNPGSTATDKGIKLALNNVFSTSHGARDHVVKVMIVVTDGQSDDPINTQIASNAAHSKGVVVFSVGVGPTIKTSELNQISTEPDCTHTFTVTSFEEIRFMTEEIQKATCIAPLFITHTYTCEISKCPPLAILTGSQGVTVDTNITCGGMNVYSAFNNPYPGSAHYETLQASLAGHPTEHYYSTTNGQILYLNLKDNQLALTTSGSRGCLATVTPRPGDQTDNTISVKCFQRHVEIPCKDDYFNCTEKWNFPNPCTKANLVAGKDKFPHPYFNNKFLMCDLSGKVLIVICPPGELFEADCSQCIGKDAVGSANCNNSLSTAVANPCSRENILAGKLYFAYPGSTTKYIHCDIWGHPWERECLPGMEWEQREVTCIVPGDSHCRHHVDGDPLHYPHDCDPHLYIQCDLNGQSFVRQCELDYLFLPSSRTCVQIGFPGSESLVYTCRGSYITYGPPVVQTTPYYQPVVTAGAAHSALGNQFQPPCTLANIQAGELYFPYQYNRHQYIQCDLNGFSYLKSCSDSGHDWYDQYSHTCVDGPVQVDPFLTNAPVG